MSRKETPKVGETRRRIEIEAVFSRKISQKMKIFKKREKNALFFASILP
jgi:hypothetical protein